MIRFFSSWRFGVILIALACTGCDVARVGFECVKNVHRC